MPRRERADVSLLQLLCTLPVIHDKPKRTLGPRSRRCCCCCCCVPCHLFRTTENTLVPRIAASSSLHPDQTMLEPRSATVYLDSCLPGTRYHLRRRNTRVGLEAAAAVHLGTHNSGRPNARLGLVAADRVRDRSRDRYHHRVHQ